MNSYNLSFKYNNIMNTMNSYNLSLKYNSGYKDIDIRKFEFVAKTQFLTEIKLIHSLLKLSVSLI